MNNSQLHSQFVTAYRNAKLLIEQNEAMYAREYIITCMSILLEEYIRATTVIERAKLHAHICEFKNISATLYEKGITADVKTWFGLAQPKEKESAKSVIPAQTEKIVDDNSIDWAADIFAKYSKSVVTISAKCGSMSMNGTGFIISDRGYLLTNDHVVFDESTFDFYKKINMTLQGTKIAIPIQVIDSDKKSDVALCKFDVAQTGAVTPINKIQDYSKLLPGASVLVIGNGLSMGLAPFTGIVKFPHDSDGNLVSTVPSNHGDSGGPVFNRKGECVGINKSITVSVTRGASTLEAHGITNATPMDKIDELLAKWCKQHNIEL